VGAGGEVELIHGAFEEVGRFWGDGAVLTDLFGGHAGICGCADGEVAVLK